MFFVFGKYMYYFKPSLDCIACMIMPLYMDVLHGRVWFPDSSIYGYDHRQNLGGGLGEI